MKKTFKFILGLFILLTCSISAVLWTFAIVGAIILFITGKDYDENLLVATMFAFPLVCYFFWSCGKDDFVWAIRGLLFSENSESNWDKD